jgi:uncharacterized protein (DUF1697 family)
VPIHVALLRGINVGGHQLVAMTDLRGMLTKLGFTGVQSLLQSGNIVFRGDQRAAATVETLLETEARKRLRVDVRFFVRSRDEWDAIVTKNPFPDEAERDPAHLVAMCLKRVVGKKEIEALQAAISGREIARGAGRDIYLVYPDGIGRSKLTNAVIERTLGTSGTARNWNTVLKIKALVQSA